jgi:NTE family protein
MRKFAILALVAALLFFGPQALRAEEGADRPKIGLALSGGGARGGAHVGVLRAIEEYGIPIDYIAGTSMGAIIGALYASGYTADDIEQVLIDTDWKSALTDKPPRTDQTMRKKALDSEFLIPYRVGFNKGKLELPLGAISGQHLDQIFQALFLPVFGISDFDRLSIPFRAVATDLVTGQAVVLSHGSLSDAVRASMSVPGVFAPVRIGQHLLVDGGMANNLPVDIVREMGADIVIAVDISSPLLTEKQLTSVLSVTEQLSNFLTRRNADEQIASLGPGDILVVPELGDFSAADFEGADEIVSLGYDAMVLQHDSLLRLAIRPGEDPMPFAPKVDSDYIVEYVRIENGSVLNDAIIRSRLAVELGQPLDLAALNESVDKIYSLDVFQSVTYNIETNENGQYGIVVKANPRPWGPNYLQFGMELSSDFSSESDFLLGVAYTRNALNSLGGELRVIASIGRVDQLSVDFYQPIDLKASWFVEPQLFWSRRNFNLWMDDINIAKYEISALGTDFGFGRNLSTTDQLRLDYQYARGKGKLITGTPIEPVDGRVRIGELNLNYLHDSLDNQWFPNKGMQHFWTYRYATERLGANYDFEQAAARGAFAFSSGKNTILFNYTGGYSFDNTAPVERWFQLGGLGRLSGLVPNQLAGRHAALAALAYYRRLNNFNLIPVYAGATLETGNTWNNSSEIGFNNLRYSGSIFVGADTPIGPIYLAVGHSDNGENAVYFYVGNPFRAGGFD